MPWTARLLPFVLLVAACSPSSQPATTPATAPTSRATATTIEVTTTLDRIAEIEAIYQDLEERRLDALYRGDREAFRALYVDNAYLEESMQLFDLVEFDGKPDVRVEVVEVVHDGAECLAASTVVTEGDTFSDPTVKVLELLDSQWLISFVGTGWTCDGPNPFG
jgi:hypothetical protein